MSAIVELRIPGYPECWDACGNCGAGDVTVLEVLVKPGDRVGHDQAVIVLDTGKVALDIPSPHEGRVVEVLVCAGERVVAGQLILTLEQD